MVHPTSVPTCAFGASSGSVTNRVRRLIDPRRQSRAVAAAAGVAAIVLVIVPVVIMGLD